MRIGTGYDVHKLVGNRKLILGGIQIPFAKGLLGHSDADVLTHSIIDALLGAAALGDIGKHFPDNNPKYKNISSMLLLKNVKELLNEKGYKIINIDSTIIAEKPKISLYVNKMKESISHTLNVNIDQVNVKATTEEGLGFTGKMEGISAQSVCLIE